MAEIIRNKTVRAGDWRTLESGWNAKFVCAFELPIGAQVKVRYGAGWWFGKDRQRQTLDGVRKTVEVGRAGVFFARVQMKVNSDANVTYAYIPVGP